MALESKRITKKEFQTYYEPLRSDFERMVNSVNSSMGFGQIIQKYIGTEVLNTYYHVWDNNLNEQVVLDKTTGAYYPPEQAGPMLWNTSASNGLGFLNGLISLSGYRKYKYCASCSDRNTPAFQSVDNFKKRYDQVGSLLSTHNTLDAYLFYDFALTRFNNVFPAVKYDDGINVTFYFKDVNGTNKSLDEIGQITNKPVSEIEISIDDAEIVKPQEGANTVITSCCDELLSYVISGQYNVGATLYTVGMSESYCWYAESLTDQTPTVPETITFTNGGRSCAECVRLNPCPSPCEEMSLGYTEGRTNPQSDACSASQLIYEYDGNEGVLYQQGQCGNSKADMGYYSDGRIIYFVDRDGNMNEVGPCPRPFEGPWVTGISVIDQFGMTGDITGQYPFENLYLDYTANGDMSTIITSFNGEIWGYSIEMSTDSGSTYGPIGYYSGSGSTAASPMDIFTNDKDGNPFTSYYFNGYGSNPPYSNRLFLAQAISRNTYNPPPMWDTRLFSGQYYRQRIYPFWQDLGSYYETVVSAGDVNSTATIVSQTNYYNGSPNF